MSDIAPVKCGDKSTRPPFKRAGELTWPMATCKLRRSRCSAARQPVRGSGVFRGEQHERRESARGRRFWPGSSQRGGFFPQPFWPTASRARERNSWAVRPILHSFNPNSTEPGVARRIVLPIPGTDRFLRPFYEILRFGRASCGSRFLQRHSLGVLRETGVCSRGLSIPGSIDFRPWSDADKFVCETDRRQSRFQAWQRSPRLHEVCRSGGWNLAPEGG